MKLPWPWILAGLRRYLVLALLMLSTLVQVLGYLTGGEAAAPQVPPEGYVVRSERVRLAWFRGDASPTLTLQLIEAGGDFDAPLQSHTVRRSSSVISGLKPATTYRWRLMDPATGDTSAVAGFRTADHLVRF